MKQRYRPLAYGNNSFIDVMSTLALRLRRNASVDTFDFTVSAGLAEYNTFDFTGCAGLAEYNTFDFMVLQDWLSAIHLTLLVLQDFLSTIHNYSSKIYMTHISQNCCFANGEQ